MDLFAQSGTPWTLHQASWQAAVARLHGGLAAGTLEAAALSPLVEHFERAWLHLGSLARVAAAFQPPPGSRPLPIQHLADFVLDDLLDVFRSASSEVALLIPDDAGRWNGDPSPQDILEEAGRFDRYLAVARLASAATAGTDPLSTAIARVAEAMADWSSELAPLVAAVSEILTAVNYGAAAGFSTAPRAALPC